MRPTARVGRPAGSAWVSRAVLLVALHSIGVGLLLAFRPGAGLRFAGWSGEGDLFFPHQSGVFHLVLAFAYLWEWFRHRSVAILVASKSAAVLFLVPMTLAGQVPWAVPFSGAADGLMGLAVLLLHRRARRSR